MLIDVYLITCVPSGKHYVGITSKGVDTRWKAHLKDAKNKTYALYEAIRKYGSESFRVELIEQCETWEQACAQERFWIQYVGTRPPFGYNLTEGGDGMQGLCETTRKKIAKTNTGRKASENTRDKMSRAHKGHVASEETRRKIAKSNTGKVHAAETRKKLSDAHKGRKLPAEHRAKISAAATAAWSRRKLKILSQEVLTSA